MERAARNVVEYRKSLETIAGSVAKARLDGLASDQSQQQVAAYELLSLFCTQGLIPPLCKAESQFWLDAELERLSHRPGGRGVMAVNIAENADPYPF